MQAKTPLRLGLLAVIVIAAVSVAGCGSANQAAGLQSTHPLVRSAAVERLGTVGDMSAYDDLVVVLRQDPDRLVRSQAAFALGQMGRRYYSIGFYPLVDALENDASVFVRSASALSLANTRDSRSVEPLVAALRDTDRGEMAVRYGDKVIVYKACVSDAARTSLRQIVQMNFTSTAQTADAQRDEVAGMWEAWYTPRQNLLPRDTALAKR
ncbi:MAG: HEAT repeat domain-containing protein [Planctomycetes bacterium]|nr:HEAT repeat domain-containing protein [Planctomycetota bacterium]